MVSVLCIGIGNHYRQDDSVGIHIAARLRSQNLPHLRVIDHSGEGAALMDAWRDADIVFLIDAVSSGAEPGTLVQFAAHDRPLPAGYFAFSTHAFGVVEAIELARTLGELPSCCIVFGIEGARFDFGTELSPRVEQAVPVIVPRIVSAIASLQHDC